MITEHVEPWACPRIGMVQSSERVDYFFTVLSRIITRISFMKDNCANQAFPEAG